MNSLWDILSVAIGISFIFMILSILNSWIQDLIASTFQIRANNLADIMQNLLEPGALELHGKDKAREKPLENEGAGSRSPKRPSKHKARINETLKSIAQDLKDLDVTIADWREANQKILDALQLPTGVSLTIPKHAYTVKAASTINNLAEKVKESIDSLGSTKSKAQQQDEPLPHNTLKSMAEYFEVALESLRDANLEFLDTLPLKVGEKLKIPKKEAAAYAVQANDTLQSVAQKFDIKQEKLRNANHEIYNALQLPAGITLTIPEYLYTVKSGVSLNTLAGNYEVAIKDLRDANLTLLDDLPFTRETWLTVPGSKADPYMVQEGDTIQSLAEAFGLSISDLQAANKELQKENPWAELPSGKTIQIPRPEIGQLASRKNILNQLIANPVGVLYSHPIIHSLSKPGKLPDRIPTKNFTVAVLDLLDDIGRGESGKKPTDTINMDFIIRGITNLEQMGDKNPAGAPPPLAFRLRSLLYTAQINTQINTKEVKASIDEFQKAVSDWFDDTIARGSLWYKQKLQVIGIICGVILAIVLNADTIGFANALWHDAVLRDSLSQAAVVSANQGQPSNEQARQELTQLADLGLPLGWSLKLANPNTPDPRDFPITLVGWLAKLAGLVLTGFAISQGSQIWFDLMNRLINLRSSELQPASDEHPAKDKK